MIGNSQSGLALSLGRGYKRINAAGAVQQAIAGVNVQMDERFGHEEKNTVVRSQNPE
jgi:hypothetical protein